ncbi:hypothetical protein PC121_g886 [Phytophthora cactorum]|nr:hypothetical protein PC120_g7193 [Phytophthora cactorum]KAG3103643.1 hypothetical protein PC121_g886 [Phytophthora cactorum]KAG4037758.1 hypothetical protein PC123_g26678 [Phytophthora cactorum]
MVTTKTLHTQATLRERGTDIRSGVSSRGELPKFNHSPEIADSLFLFLVFTSDWIASSISIVASVVV